MSQLFQLFLGTRIKLILDLTQRNPNFKISTLHSLHRLSFLILLNLFLYFPREKMASNSALSLLIMALTVARAQNTTPTPSSTVDGCTTTSTITQTLYAAPPYWSACQYDPTYHIYPSSVTTTTSVDCHGCSHLQIKLVPNVFCPAMTINATATETTPFTAHTTVCSSTTSS